MAAGPIEQFEIHKLVELPAVNLPLVGPLDLSITNSTLSMLIAFALVVTFMTVVTLAPRSFPAAPRPPARRCSAWWTTWPRT